MTVRLYDTKAQVLRDFVPLDPQNVTMYVCGPTVQSGPGIHHLRAALAFDLLRRWLEHRFERVTFVRNVTDIDDKVLANSTEREPWWALAYRMEREFTQAYSAIGILPPTYEPRATASIPQMQELIARLIEGGHAYAAAGDVYFDVRSWSEYGALTHQSIDAMEPAGDADPRGKRDPRDFALWKAYKPGEPGTASWPSPWGRGRPGWHIECSAMAGKYLGDTFDIHGGGLDLRFPHHENELAQSRAAGRGFARHWMHNAWVTMAGEKMSKSLGNTADVAAAVAKHGGRAVRLWLAGPHYRSAIELSEASLAEAAAQLARIDSFLERSATLEAGWVAYAPLDAIPAEFVAAMDDDLATPTALAVLFGIVKDGNVALDAGDREAAIRARLAVLLMLGVFGLDPAGPEWAQASAGDDLKPVVDGLVSALLEQRAQARARKDWPAADAVRDTLKTLGLKVADTPAGPRWSLEN